MREDLLAELEAEYEQQRIQNERIERQRREEAERADPGMSGLLQKRQDLIFATMRGILQGQRNARDLPERMETVLKEIRERLTANGFPPDYLSPVYRCPICKDTGYTGEPVREPCACLRKAYQQKLRRSIGLEEDSRETFENYREELLPDGPLPGKPYSQRKLTGAARKVCEKWTNEWPDAERQNLLLTGPSGLGKTFLMRAMAARLIERDVNVLLISAYAFLEMARKNYFGSDPAFREMLEAEVLMIDDLGSEPMMQNVTVEQLFNLLSVRENRRLSTVVSTNLNLEELRARYTERIASRMTDRRSWQVIPLEGQDLRESRGQGEA